MAHRLDQTQIEHDDAIRLIAQTEFDLYGRGIYTNPGPEHNYEVSGVYPDIVLTTKRAIFSERVILVAEVETFDSVNESEVSQWKTYSQLGCNFVLYVPIASKTEVVQLCRKFGIEPSELKWYSYLQGTLTTGHI
jgi:hypothetical protein